MAVRCTGHNTSLLNLMKLGVLCDRADGEASFAEPWNDPLLKEIETATHKVCAAQGLYCQLGFDTLKYS